MKVPALEKTGRFTSSLSRLVLFLFCLSFAGTLAACIHYAAVDLPARDNIVNQAPENRPRHPTDCEIQCNTNYVRCCGEMCVITGDDHACRPALNSCLAQC